MITKKIIKKIRELAKENLDWIYESNIQKYEDMKDTQYFIRDWIGCFDKEDLLSDQILIHTNIMYNDMYADTKRTYWCVRNTVSDVVRIQASGNTMCGCCGEKKYISQLANYDEWDYDDLIDAIENDDLDYNDKYDNTKSFLCEACNKNEEICYCCGRTCSKEINVVHVSYGGKVYLCQNCEKRNTFLCPCCNERQYLPTSFGVYALPWIKIKDIKDNAHINNTISIPNYSKFFNSNMKKTVDNCIPTDEKDNLIHAYICKNCENKNNLFSKSDRWDHYMTKDIYTKEEIMNNPLLFKLCACNALKSSNK